MYSTGVFLFSNSRSGMAYVLQDQVQAVPDWLSDQKYGLWHLLEFAGALASLFFMVGSGCVYDVAIECGHILQTLFMMMWPLFSERYEEYEEEYEDEKQQEEDGV